MRITKDVNLNVVMSVGRSVITGALVNTDVDVDDERRKVKKISC